MELVEILKNRQYSKLAAAVVGCGGINFLELEWQSRCSAGFKNSTGEGRKYEKAYFAG